MQWFRAHDSCIYTLMLTPDGSVLVSGSATEIRFWRWADVVASLSGGGAEPVPMSQIDPGCETNGLAFDEQTGAAFAATGDGLCHAYDANSGRETGARGGHTNYLHTVVALPQSRQLATGSEDGTVRLWDMRDSSAAATGVLEPFRCAPTPYPSRKPPDPNRNSYAETLPCLCAMLTSSSLVCRMQRGHRAGCCNPAGRVDELGQLPGLRPLRELAGLWRLRPLPEHLPPQLAKEHEHDAHRVGHAGSVLRGWGDRLGGRGAWGVPPQHRWHAGRPGTLDLQLQLRHRVQPQAADARDVWRQHRRGRLHRIHVAAGLLGAAAVARRGGAMKGGLIRLPIAKAARIYSYKQLDRQAVPIAIAPLRACKCRTGPGPGPSSPRAPRRSTAAIGRVSRPNSPRGCAKNIAILSATMSTWYPIVKLQP